MVGQAVFVEDGVNLGIVVAAFAQDFDHFALRVLLGVVPFGQFDHDHVAVFTACELLEGDVKIGAHFAGVRHQKGMLGGHLEGAHVAVACALHDRHHLPFELAFVSGRKELNAHLIAAKTGAQIAFFHEDVIRAAARNHIAGAAGRELQDALHQILLHGELVLFGLDFVHMTGRTQNIHRGLGQNLTAALHHAHLQSEVRKGKHHTGSALQGA